MGVLVPRGRYRGGWGNHTGMPPPLSSLSGHQRELGLKTLACRHSSWSGSQHGTDLSLLTD